MLEYEFLAEIHPVDMLVDLVIAHELDPWEIDLEEITRKFIEKVRAMKKLNLRLSGRTLLAASILLRIKSEHLFEVEEEIPEEEEEYEEERNERVDIPPIREPLRRKSERKVTLFDLVSALQLALKEELIKKNFPKRRREKKLVIEVDEENIREKIEKVYIKVKRLSSLDKIITLSMLLAGGEKKELVEVLLALLYLDYEGRLRIWQDEIFGEIFIAIPEEAK